MKRDYDKLLNEFKQRYFVKHAKAGQLYASDYTEIKNRAMKKTGEENGNTLNLIYNCIDIALQVGVMIGYKAGRYEKRKHERV